MNEIKKALLEYYNDCKARSLILGVSMPEILYDDVFIIYVTDDDKIVLVGIKQDNKEHLESYLDKTNNSLVLPDVFDIIYSLSYETNNIFLDADKRLISKNLLYRLKRGNSLGKNDLSLDYNFIILGQSVERIGFIDSEDLYSTPFKYSKVLKIGENNFIEAYDKCFQYSDLIELINEHAKKLGDKCFYSCKNLTKVSLPNLIYAGVSCFEDCTDLSYVCLSKVESIKDRVFCNCTSLSQVDGLSYAKNVGDCSFLNTQVSELDLRDCASIGKSAFEDSSLRKIKLSNKLTFVDMNAFYNIKNSFFDRFVIEWYGSRSDFNKVVVKSGNDTFLNARVKFM